MSKKIEDRVKIAELTINTHSACSAVPIGSPHEGVVQLLRDLRHFCLAKDVSYYDAAIEASSAYQADKREAEAKDGR